MSELFKTLHTSSEEINLTEYCGPNHNIRLQITGRDGYLQLSASDAAELASSLVEWVKKECERKAKKIDEKIRDQEIFKDTVFEESVRCEAFIREFEVPKFCVNLLDRISV